MVVLVADVTVCVVPVLVVRVVLVDVVNVVVVVAVDVVVVVVVVVVIDVVVVVVVVGVAVVVVTVVAVMVVAVVVVVVVTVRLGDTFEPPQAFRPSQRTAHSVGGSQCPLTLMFEPWHESRPQWMMHLVFPTAQIMFTFEPEFSGRGRGVGWSRS